MTPVKPDTPAHAIIEEELRLLARVTSALSEISAGVEGAPDFDAEMISLRDQIGESRAEDIPVLVEQMIRISALAQRYGKGRDLPVEPESPYFAHLRLEEGDRVRDVLIGKRGYIDRERRVQIVDWRNAPVSRIYYRYEEGDDYEEHFGNRSLEGWIRARRSLTIEGGRLVRIGCPQGTFIADERGDWYEAVSVAPTRLAGGQGTAARVPAVRPGGQDARLGVHSGPVLRADKHLPEIAALIDHEQFDLITRPESGLVVLQGGAGSGKTTVALHRVAYLSFAMPGRFHGSRMLVLVLTQAMVRYVEHVLPSLGVRGVPVMTADAWLGRMRRRLVPAAPRGYNDDTPSVVTRFKKHPLILELCREHLERQAAEVEVMLREEVDRTADGQQVLGRWKELSNQPLQVRAAKLRVWLKERPNLDRVTGQRARAVSRRILRRLRDLLADWGEILTDRTLLGEAAGRLAPGEFSGRELDQVCSWCSRQLEGGRPRESQGRDAALERARKPGERDNPYISLDGVDEREGLEGRLDRPDDGILLYLSLLKRGALQPTGGNPVRYEHLVLDEAQDMSVVVTKVLLECTTRLRSITIAGDTAQRMVFDNEFSDWETLLRRVGAPPATTRTLRLGYRSTEQIMELAEHIIGGAFPHAEAQPTRSGAPVEILRFGSQGEAVGMLAEALRSLALREPLASVALIARHLEQARIYAQDLVRSEVPGVRLVANQEFHFRAGIEVTDVTQVKGLEFDYVVLLDATAANYPDTLESRHLLHIGATRAAHQLWIVSVGPVSPILEGLG